ncbi:MAG: J domain-containing protein [Magnetococcus sp. DMHC-6]
MKNPFQILDVPVQTDDETVRKAWLNLVRIYPPERDPTRFQEIRTAYEAIKTYRDRSRFHLFEPCEPVLESLMRHGLKRAPVRPLSEKMILDLLGESSRNWRMRWSHKGKDESS